MKLFKKIMRYTFITIFILAFLKIAIGVSGFCYDEMRYLSKQEKIDRVLLGDKAHLMTEEEKIETLKEKGIEYPDCCKISGQPDGYGLVSWILNPLIFNRHFVQLEIYSCLLYTSPSPRDQRGSRMPSSA